MYEINNCSDNVMNCYGVTREGSYASMGRSAPKHKLSDCFVPVSPRASYYVAGECNGHYVSIECRTYQQAKALFLALE